MAAAARRDCLTDVAKSQKRRRRERLVEICRALPEVEIQGDHHLAFVVRKKKLAYYLDDHHGDGLVALACKAPPGENHALVDFDPERFYIPAYVGPKGWVGLRLDLASVDWDEVAELVHDAYRLAAPKTLARQLD